MILINLALIILLFTNKQPYIVKKKEILTMKQDNLIVAVQNGAGVLEENANRSLNCLMAGRRLIEHIGQEGGMNDVLVTKIEDYVTRSKADMQCMNSLRKPFTQQLTDWQKRFVSFENEIDPSRKGTPANELAVMRNNWLMKQKQDAEAAAQRLQANFQRTEKRIAGRDDLDDTQKAAAIGRAEGRLQSGRIAIRMNEIATELCPVATEPDGYIDLLRFWWQEIGRNLPDSDLERIFRPMLSYARKQARKGVVVDSVYVEYREVPKGSQAA